MKLVMKCILAIVCIAALGGGAAFYFTSDMVDEADAFFNDVKVGETATAYSRLSGGFKQNVSLEQLEEFVAASGFADTESTSWSSRSFENNIGTVKGSLTLSSGATVPLTVQFVKEDGMWKLHNIKKMSAGFALDKTPDNMPIPSSEEIQLLVQKTTALFAAAIDAKDMTVLYETIAKLWREQTSVERLNGAFKQFFAADAKFSKLNSLTPMLSKAPWKDGNRVLVLEGTYPTRPNVFTFSYKFIPEGDEWKIVGLQVTMVAPKEEEESAGN